MKRILAGALALSLLAGAGVGAASAQDWGRHDGDRGYSDRGHDCRGDWRGDRGDRGDRGERGEWRGGRGYGYGYGRGEERREWRRGEYWRGGYGGYYVSDPYRYRLRPAPYGYRWVRDDEGDFLLTAIASGLILDVIAHSRY